jgi:hypothetical protein
VETLRKLFGEAFVTQPVKLGLFGRACRKTDEGDPAPFLGDGDHAGCGNGVPLRQSAAGLFVQRAGDRQAARLLKAPDGIGERGAFLAVDHAGREAEPFEHDLHLHDRTLLWIGDGRAGGRSIIGGQLIGAARSAGRREGSALLFCLLVARAHKEAKGSKGGKGKAHRGSFE